MVLANLTPQMLPAFLFGYTSCLNVVLLLKHSLNFSLHFYLDTPHVNLLYYSSNAHWFSLQTSLWKHLMFAVYMFYYSVKKTLLYVSSNAGFLYENI